MGRTSMFFVGNVVLKEAHLKELLNLGMSTPCTVVRCETRSVHYRDRSRNVLPRVDVVIVVPFMES